MDDLLATLGHTRLSLNEPLDAPDGLLEALLLGKVIERQESPAVWYCARAFGSLSQQAKHQRHARPLASTKAAVSWRVMRLPQL